MVGNLMLDFGTTKHEEDVDRKQSKFISKINFKQENEDRENKITKNSSYEKLNFAIISSVNERSSGVRFCGLMKRINQFVVIECFTSFTCSRA